MRKALTKIKRILNNFMDALSSFFQNSRRLKEFEQREKEIEQEQQEVCELAAKFDTLGHSGFNKILEMMAGKVDATIAEATDHKGDPPKQCVYVNRWDAQRELLDAVIAFVEDTKKHRDEIREQKRLAIIEADKPPVHTWDLMGQL